MRRRKSNKHIVGCIGILVAIIYSYTEFKSVEPEYISSTIKLSSCVDGDTARFKINDKEEVVRFLAIDTPETVKPGTDVQPYGKEASSFTCNALTEAKNIKLEYDSGSKQKDKYNRILAWVWVDDSLLQKELISQGYAQVKYVYGDYKYTEELEELQKNAKNSKIGIWSE